MPIRRAHEDGARPPLARGSACHRCFARKVRCSGQPDPATGVHACAACLRTARFKGHDLAHCRCAFGSEGLCSEEGGPNLLGEIYPNAGPAPRRKLMSRSSTSSSSRSLTSLASASSSGTDVSLASSSTTSLDSPLTSPITPISPSAPMHSMSLEGPARINEKSFSLPREARYQPAPAPLAFELPPPLPMYAPVPGLVPPHYTPNSRNASPSAPWPDQPATQTPNFDRLHAPAALPLAGPSRHASPQQHEAPSPRPSLLSTDSCSKSLLARRTGAKMAPMSISLPPPPGSTISPAGSRSSSRAASPVRVTSLDHSASSWTGGQPPHRNELNPGLVPRSADSNDSFIQHVAGGLPLPQPELQYPSGTVYDAPTRLDAPTELGAFASYMSGAPSPGLLIPMGGFQSSLHLPLDPRQSVPANFGPQPISHPFPSSSSQTRSVYVHEANSHTSAASSGAFDLTGWTGSIHLYSPGLTFSSSTPHWFSQGTQTQYFQPRG
ncbi:hypothetical protein C6P46_002197 [Rhodotorula mucilaginosa]|uniref:Uncharacterized protein n=1 Tax=Rhodotorula mucilaginosa TaxID=5537 RepID=A0A9P6VTN8_RHOMI|nr:hypothetical protein C6P46_002197 [Rhodotorula mucilaginosa]